VCGLDRPLGYCSPENPQGLPPARTGCHDGRMGRIYIRPPENWSSMTEEEQLAWIRQLQAEVMAEAEAEGEDDGD
jgi:hypothetical protein